MQYHRKTLSILAAAALLIAAATQLSGCISIPSRESTAVDQTSPTSSTSSTSASASASGTSSAANGPLDAVTWSFPTNESGWQIDFIDQEGRNQLVKPNGCMYSTMQNLFSGQEDISDKTETDYQVEQRINGFKRQMRAAEGKATPSTDVKTYEGKPVDMMRVDIDYTGQDGGTYRSTAWLRVFAHEPTPVFTVVNYACPASAYSEAEMRDLLSQTTLANVTQPTMK